LINTNWSDYESPCVSDISQFLTILSDQYLKILDVNLNKELLWNEIVKNSKFYQSLGPPASSPSVVPPPPLTINTSKNFIFREIISLKELYKEFERC